MLFKLSQDKDYSRVKRITLKSIGWKEKDLENLIAKHISDLIHTNDLLTIFTERPRKEEPDILALDKEGDLYIFELKRWSSNKENLLQVMRYGQLYGSSEYDELNSMYQKYKNSKDELSYAHQRFFDLKTSLESNMFNMKQHFVIITNGLDQETIEAISFWRKNGLNMDAIIYWVFEIDGKPYIEFNTYSPIEGYLEYESNNYILNTNYSNDPQTAIIMAEIGKAAAFSSGWKEKITRLQKGDTVFLYQSGTGIVGYGIADGRLQIQGEDNNEYFMLLDDYKRLCKPISATEMKELCNKGFPFAQTMYHISDDCKDTFVKEIAEGKR